MEVFLYLLRAVLGMAQRLAVTAWLPRGNVRVFAGPMNPAGFFGGERVTLFRDS